MPLHFALAQLYLMLRALVTDNHISSTIKCERNAPKLWCCARTGSRCDLGKGSVVRWDGYEEGYNVYHVDVVVLAASLGPCRTSGAHVQHCYASLHCKYSQTLFTTGNINRHSVHMAGQKSRRSLQQGPGGQTCQSGAQSAEYRCQTASTSNGYQFCQRLCENGLGRGSNAGAGSSTQPIATILHLHHWGCAVSAKWRPSRVYVLVQVATARAAAACKEAA